MGNATVGYTVGDMFPSKWLNGDEILNRNGGGPVEFEIDQLTFEQFGQGRDAQAKPVLWFKNEIKGLILNKSNAETLKLMFGDGDRNWWDKKVKLLGFYDNIGGQQKCVIRILGGPGGSNSPVGISDARSGGGRPAPRDSGQFPAGAPAPAGGQMQRPSRPAQPAVDMGDPDDVDDPNDGPAEDLLIRDVKRAYKDRAGGDWSIAGAEYRNDTGGVHPSTRRAKEMLDRARADLQKLEQQNVPAPVAGAAPPPDNFDDSDPFADE